MRPCPKNRCEHRFAQPRVCVSSDLGKRPRDSSDARPSACLLSISSLITKSPENALRRRLSQGLCLWVNPILTHTPLAHFPFPPRYPYFSMSASNPTAGPSTDNFTAIFNAASIEYQALTGKSLDTHPFSAQLDSCRSPEAVSDVLRTQAQAFSKFCKGDERLMAWLDPTIHILSTFSDTLGEGIGLVSHLVQSSVTVLGHPVLSRSHLQKRSLPGSVFSSEYGFSPVPYSSFA